MRYGASQDWTESSICRRWFEDDIILLCLRWYFRFKLSYQGLVEILGERGLSISHHNLAVGRSLCGHV